MDRSWMSKLRTSAEYKHGVQQFLSFAFHDVRDGCKTLCTCVNCANKRMQTYDEVKTHLRCHGILQGYTTWICHGEQFHSCEDVFEDVLHTSNDASISDIHAYVPRQGDSRRLDDTRGLLNAVFNMRDYDSLDSISDDDKVVLSNEEGNFPVLYDEQLEAPNRMATSPAEENVATEGQDGSKKEETFLSFLKDTDSNLYEGCQKISKLSFLVRLFHLKVLHGWTQASFKSVLDLLSNAFP